MSETPVARPSRPSVRFTALDQAETSRLAQITKRIRPTVAPANARSKSVSRRNEILVDAGVREFVVGELQGEHGERDADDALADQLGARRQAERALPGDLGEVVEEPDQAEARHEEQRQQRRRRSAAARTPARPRPAEQGRRDDDDAAHGGRTALGEVRRGAVLADELAVVLVDQEPDEDRRAQQGDEQRHGR